MANREKGCCVEHICVVDRIQGQYRECKGSGKDIRGRRKNIGKVDRILGSQTGCDDS